MKFNVKKGGFTVFLVIIVVFIVVLVKYAMPKQKQAENSSNSTSLTQTEEIDNSTSLTQTEEIDNSTSQSQTGETDEPKTTDILILVNRDNKLPDNYEPDLTAEGAKFAKVLFDDFQEMRESAKKENIYLMIASAYRTSAEQEQLFEELGPSVAAPAGYSEHQTGLAIDFSYGGLTAEQTNMMWDWLSENAHNYGFILRYPKDKQQITGFDYEPWHYRYVGKEHAKAIYENGLVLEEYLAEL